MSPDPLFPRLIACLVAASTVVACSSSSSSSSTGGTDAAADATVANDAGADAGSVAVQCAKTADDLCTTSPADCPYPTFADARAAACCGSGCIKVSTSPCGGYDAAQDQGVDTVTTYYFDPASGKLVATVRYGAAVVGGYACGAGPATFQAPNCTRENFGCLADAGTDAAPDDAAAE